MLETVLLPILFSGAVSASVDFDLISASHVSKALRCAAYASHSADGDEAKSPADPDRGSDKKAAPQNSLPGDKRGGDGFSFDVPNSDSDNSYGDKIKKPF